MRKLYAVPVLLWALVFTSTSNAQCTNTALYPPNSITPDPNGLITSITGCSYQTEYSRIIGIVDGTAYRFTISDGSYITVRQGTSNGPVLGYGTSPLLVVTTSTEDLFVHWNTDASCGNATICLATTVQRFLDCLPPSLSVATDNDCPNGEFLVNVTVTDTGDASSLAFAYTVDGGGLMFLGGVGLGTYALGPFPLGAVIDLTVAHGDDAQCNTVINDITSLPCAIESCGPDVYTHCYGNNETYIAHYQGTSGFPLGLLFNSGGISPTGGDVLTIHDGLTDAAPVLYTGVGNNGDLTGVSVISTNPGHYLTIKLVSSGSWSCGDGVISPAWNYTVVCVDCTDPVGELGAVTTDCVNGQFTVAVEIVELGSADSVAITNNAGVPYTWTDGTGTVLTGPFPVGAPVAFGLLNSDNPLCGSELGTVEVTECAVEVDCAEPPVQGTYCYVENDARSWLYQSAGAVSMSILFTQGGIESAIYDHLTIHDGSDNTAPVLWTHTGDNFNLAGLSVVSTGAALYMEMTSDYSVSCLSGSMASWNWTVACLDCISPAAAFEVLPDCAHNAFNVAVDVTSLGDGATVAITNDLTGDTLSGIGLGTAVVGPFPVGTGVQISVLNGDNALCRALSPVLTLSQEECVITACENTTFEHCYANADTAWFIFQSGVNAPVTIAFLQGALLPGDNVLLYNGIGTSAQLVYSGNFGGDVSGFGISSSNPDDALTMLIASNGDGSCATGEAAPTMQWTVGCGLVGVEETTVPWPLLFPQPANDVLNVRWAGSAGSSARLELFDLTGRCVLTETCQAVPTGVCIVDVGHLRAGGYLLRLTSGNDVFSGPVLIER